ncbi:MAG: ABC transporter permease subunit [Saccharofermentanales bacterium]
MNILRQELRMSFRSWMYFTIGLLLTLGIFGAFFNTFKEDAKLMDQLLKNFPAEFKAAFGFADVNLSEVEGFFSFITSYIVLIGAVYGMKLGVTLLSEEGRKMTSDFLLSKPVRRYAIVSSKLAAALIYIIAQNIAVFAIGLALIHAMIKEGIDVRIFALMTFSLFFVQLFFMGIGFAIAAASRKIKSVMPVTLGVVFFFFIIELLNESLIDKKLSYVTPFAYFKGSGIIQNRQYDLVYIAIDIGVFLVFTILAYWIYQRKDIHAV